MIKSLLYFPQMCIISAILVVFCNRAENPSKTPVVYSLKIVTDSCGTVVDGGVHRISEGGSYELIAGQPKQGYQFAFWAVDAGEESVTLQNRDSKHAQVMNVQGDAVVKAVFTKNEYRIYFVVQPVNSVDTVVLDPPPKNNGLYEYGTEVKVRVVPSVGWKICQWDRMSKVESEFLVVAVIDSIRDTVICAPIRVPGNVICVKSDALQNGGGDIGSSWVDSYRDLNEALVELGTNTSKNSVWIAQGTYKPVGQLLPFQIPKSNVLLIGGFSGFETGVTQRDSLRNTTILDGQTSSTVNASAVVNVPQGCDNVLLSTLTIRNAGGEGTFNGGVYAANAVNLKLFRCIITNNSPYGIRPGFKTEIKKCAITSNSGTSGAGIFIAKDSVMVMQSIIANNKSSSNGAGIYLTGSDNDAFIINSDIVNNTATGTNIVAGIYRVDGNNTKFFIANSIIWGNVVSGGTSYGAQLSHADTVVYSTVQNPVAGEGIGIIASDGRMTGVSSEDPHFKNSAELAGYDSIWFNSDDGLMPQCSCVIDKAAGVPDHPTWNPSSDIRNAPISRSGGKSYDMGAYDQ